MLTARPTYRRALRRQAVKLRRGVVLVIVVVTVAVMAILATVIFAALQSGGGVDRIVLAADILFRFKTEIIGAPPSFYERIKTYPGGLSHLIEPLTTSKVNSCGDFYSASPDVNNWRGPYHLVPFNAADGYVLSLGIVAQDATERTTFTNGALALAIVMNDVQVADALSLKGKIDGTAGDTIWIGPQVGDSPVVVHYRIPITADC
jgi:hypothetical protein